jgi:hypothetical protein
MHSFQGIGFNLAYHCARRHFGTKAQATFLSSAIADDSDWSEAVDELAVRTELIQFSYLALTRNVGVALSAFKQTICNQNWKYVNWMIR